MIRPWFTLPPGRSATEPPEARGLARDEVRLLVAEAGRPIRHRRFTDLAAALTPGDLLVVNTSATAPAAVDGRTRGRPVVLHVSGPAPDGRGYVVELRTPDGRRVTDATAGRTVELPRGVVATLLAGHPDSAVTCGSRLWRAHVPVEGGLTAWLAVVGRPIRYSHLRADPPLAAYQTVFARPSGAAPSAEMPSAEMPSAEMPSAGRPFSTRVLAGLRARGVDVAEVVLHTGVSSLEAGGGAAARAVRGAGGHRRGGERCAGSGGRGGHDGRPGA